MIHRAKYDNIAHNQAFKRIWALGHIQTVRQAFRRYSHIQQKYSLNLGNIQPMLSLNGPRLLHGLHNKGFTRLSFISASPFQKLILGSKEEFLDVLYFLNVESKKPLLPLQLVWEMHIYRKIGSLNTNSFLKAQFKI